MKVVACSMIVCLSAVLPGSLSAQTPLDRLKTYVEIDTTNPPGNESRGVEFFVSIFEEAGIAYETAESAPGRGNIWARLEGGDEPGLVLLALEHQWFLVDLHLGQHA